MHATGCLRAEHRVIVGVLDCFEVALNRAAEAGCVRRGAFDPFIDFFRGFADRCHHCKEEGSLFPILEKSGIPREGGPIGVMLEEHEQGRRHVRAMAESLAAADKADPAAAHAFLSEGRQFLMLLRQHIDKEDQVLFRMADQVVQGGDLAQLTNSYRSAESESSYCDAFSRCRMIARELAAAYGVPNPGLAI